MPFSAAVSGRKRGSAASGVSQARWKERREMRGHGFTHRRRIAAFEAIGQDQHHGAPQQGGVTRIGKEGMERRADPGAAIPVADKRRCLRQRDLPAALAQRAANAGETCAEGEGLDLAGERGERMRIKEIVGRYGLHRSRYIDEQHDRAKRVLRRLRIKEMTSPSCSTMRRNDRRRSSPSPSLLATFGSCAGAAECVMPPCSTA